MQPSSQEFKDYMAVIEKTADSNACVYVWHPRVMGSLLPKNDKVKRNSSEIVEFSGEELTFVAFSSGENVQYAFEIGAKMIALSAPSIWTQVFNGQKL